MGRNLPSISCLFHVIVHRSSFSWYFSSLFRCHEMNFVSFQELCIAISHRPILYYFLLGAWGVVFKQITLLKNISDIKIETYNEHVLCLRKHESLCDRVERDQFQFTLALPAIFEDKYHSFLASPGHHQWYMLHKIFKYCLCCGLVLKWNYRHCVLGPLLLTWINLNPSKDK